MYDMFEDYSEWTIVIFDNILVLATDYEDCFMKMKLILRRCAERNVKLKLSKCTFGCQKVEFFGYVIEKGTYRLSDERAQAVTSIHFPQPPNAVKKMQRFLGAAIYFRPFIPNYAEKTNELYAMTAKDFDWSEKTWSKDYREVFESFKHAILHSFTLYHPDYSLQWVLKTDASDYACGWVLVQLVIDDVEGVIQQVIAFGSKKFSDAATRWSTIEKECYGVFFAVFKLQYYLTLKKFTLLTDHNNLLWMHTSIVPKIVRMRLFLQGFDFVMAHIPGKDNIFADWLSRQQGETNVDMLAILTLSGEGIDDGEVEKVANDVVIDGSNVISDDCVKTIEQKISLVHNSRMGHMGVRRTWKALNKYLPGHGVSIDQVREFVEECVWCQKLRLSMNDSLAPPVRHIDPAHPRVFCGYDTLYITPADADGYQYIHVFKLLPARLVGLYPAKDLT
jgi:hypothetical protein